MGYLLLFLLLGILLALLLTPTIIVSLISKELKKIGVDIKIYGFFHYEDVKTKGDLASSFLKNFSFVISLIKLTKITGSFAFGLQIENISLSLKMLTLNLRDLKPASCLTKKLSPENLLNIKEVLNFAFECERNAQKLKAATIKPIIEKEQISKSKEANVPKINERGAQPPEKKDIWLLFGTIGKSLLFFFLQRFNFKVRRISLDLISQSWDDSDGLSSRNIRPVLQFNQYFTNLGFRYNNMVKKRRKKIDF